MPTIDALAAAQAVSDTDEIPLSQNGVAAKATRAQLVSGLQPALALGTGQLLGRNSVGTGAPEVIGLGAGLSLSGGVLSAAAAPLALAALSTGVAPGVADLVPVGQGGTAVAIPYGSFMGGLAKLSGLDLSAMQALAGGGTAARRLDLCCERSVDDQPGGRRDRGDARSERVAAGTAKRQRGLDCGAG